MGLLPHEGIQDGTHISVRWSLIVNLEAEDETRMARGIESALKTWRAKPSFAQAPPDCLARPACVTTSFMRLGSGEEWMLSVVRIGDDVRVEGLRTRTMDGRIVSSPIAAFVVARGALDACEAWMSPAPRRPDPASFGPPPEDPLTSAVDRARRRPVPVGTWVASGIAAAALGVGIGFGVSAAGLESGLRDDGCAARPCSASRIERLENHALAADISYGVAGGAAATALVLFFFRPSKN